MWEREEKGGKEEEKNSPGAEIREKGIVVPTIVISKFAGIVPGLLLII